METRSRLGPIGFVISMLALIGTVFTIAQGTLTVNKFYEDVSEVREQLAVLNAQIKKSENLKEELLALEARVSVQSDQITQASRNAEEVVRSSTKEIDSRINDLEETVKNLPSKNVPSDSNIIKTSCLPLGEIVTIGSAKSYDFCDSNWTFQVREVQKRGVIIRSTMYAVPTTLEGLGPDKNCSIQLREIAALENGGYEAYVRGSCA